MRRAVPDVLMSTMGQSSPSHLTLSRPYRWRKVPDWEPGDVRFREDATPVGMRGGAAVTAERTRRMAEYARLRAEGLSVTEAGERLGVKRKTAGSYERERRMLRGQQQEEPTP